jgi:hypothetical protein
MDNISALSYLSVENKVPKSELLLLFAYNYNNHKYTAHFSDILSLKLERTPVYAIKKHADGSYEYEVYFYRYDPHRKIELAIANAGYLTVILDDYDTFIKSHEFLSIGINPCSNFLFKENKFIIVSYDINESFFNNNEHVTFNYYLRNSSDESLFKYVTKEEDSRGNILNTNKYGLFDHVFKPIDKEKYLVDLFESENCIIFYAYKPKTNTHAFYYERGSFEKFVLFLEYFKYDITIINYVKQNYNNNYDFCFSYDMDDNCIIQKSAIFSIF